MKNILKDNAIATSDSTSKKMHPISNHAVSPIPHPTTNSNLSPIDPKYTPSSLPSPKNQLLYSHLVRSRLSKKS